MSNTVPQAIAAASNYLLAFQRSDGRWEEFELPVGPSDAWVTGYIGLALAQAGRQCEDRCAWLGGLRAAEWLRDNRPYAAGWGYNASTGPDADSTAYAIRLLKQVQQKVEASDEEWLLARWVPGQGFATYDRSDNWGIGHPDVTPVVYWALDAQRRAKLRDQLKQSVLAGRDADGTWPAYWWRTRHYSTFLNGLLVRELGIPMDAQHPVVSTEASRAIYSHFDLAYVVANAAVGLGMCDVTRALTAELLKCQRSDGSWAGAPNLRVTRHDGSDPWLRPEGQLFADNGHLFTTASALGVLTTVAKLCAS